MTITVIESQESNYYAYRLVNNNAYITGLLTHIRDNGARNIRIRKLEVPADEIRCDKTTIYSRTAYTDLALVKAWKERV